MEIPLALIALEVSFVEAEKLMMFELTWSLEFFVTSFTSFTLVIVSDNMLVKITLPNKRSIARGALEHIFIAIV